MNQTGSQELFSFAQNHIPGGVNSPVRAFRAVGGKPVFMQSAKGAYLHDVDGNKYIDLINSWGPMILGHAHEVIEEQVIEAVKKSLSFGTPTAKEGEVAELICEMVPSLDMVRMVNSGTEATMSAIRLARGYTGKDKIIKFEGCYHGHGDSFLIAAGSGAATMGQPDSPGVTKGTAQDTITLPYNNLQAVDNLLTEKNDEIAAIILEPVAGNMGCIPPIEGYLEGLRSLCDQHDVLLIFDEVMTGFRLAKGGAQELYGVNPDLTTLGKVIGGGMPVGAYGGRKEIMSKVSPSGPVYQAGTLSGNPVAMAAGYTMLQILNNNPEVYQRLNDNTQKIVNGFDDNLSKLGLDYQLRSVGSMFCLFLTSDEIVDFDSAKSCNLDLFGAYFNSMLNQGVYLAPSQFETLFLSDTIGASEIDKIVEANYLALKQVHEAID